MDSLPEEYPSQLRSKITHFPFLAIYTRDSWNDGSLQGKIITYNGNHITDFVLEPFLRHVEL